VGSHGLTTATAHRIGEFTRYIFQNDSLIVDPFNLDAPKTDNNKHNDPGEKKEHEEHKGGFDLGALQALFIRCAE
jgi:hypothetical protein